MHHNKNNHDRLSCPRQTFFNITETCKAPRQNRTDWPSDRATDRVTNRLRRRVTTQHPGHEKTTETNNRAFARDLFDRKSTIGLFPDLGEVSIVSNRLQPNAPRHPPPRHTQAKNRPKRSNASWDLKLGQDQARLGTTGQPRVPRNESWHSSSFLCDLVLSWKNSFETVDPFSRHQILKNGAISLAESISRLTQVNEIIDKITEIHRNYLKPS